MSPIGSVSLICFEKTSPAELSSAGVRTFRRNRLEAISPMLCFFCTEVVVSYS